MSIATRARYNGTTETTFTILPTIGNNQVSPRQATGCVASGSDRIGRNTIQPFTLRKAIHKSLCEARCKAKCETLRHCCGHINRTRDFRCITASKAEGAMVETPRTSPHKDVLSSRAMD